MYYNDPNDDDQEDDNNSQFRYQTEDSSKFYNNCRPDIGNSISENRRKDLADSFGPNWASIISGLGDQ